MAITLTGWAKSVYRSSILLDYASTKYELGRPCVWSHPNGWIVGVQSSVLDSDSQGVDADGIQTCARSSRFVRRS